MGGSDTTTVQKSDPPSWQQPYIEYGLQEANRLYQTKPPQYYPGQVTADRSPFTQAAEGLLASNALGPSQDIVNQSSDAFRFATTDALNPDTNKYLQPALAGALRPTFQNLTETVIPSIRGDFQNLGQAGGTRQQIAEGLAIGRTNQAAADAGAKMYSDAYGQGLSAQSKALAFAPALQQMGTVPAQQLATVGASQEQYQQQLINDAMAKWNFEQTGDRQALTDYINSVQGNYGGQSTGRVEGGGNGPTNVISGAATGASLGAMVSGGTAVGGAWGAAIGAVIALLSSS